MSEAFADWIINEDGSLDRMGPVDDYYRTFAESRGIVLAPDHVPAEDVWKYVETRNVMGVRGG